MEVAAVEVKDVWRRFGETVAVAGVTLTIQRGQFVSLLGPSGCGKTTLLRIIAGLETKDRGEVWIEGRECSSVPPHRRPANLVFQRYALFPHLTVAENVGFALALKRVQRHEIEKRIQAMLELVRLPGFGPRRVDELSGGQAQRVALARALITDPPVLLLDEPLAALDLKLRQAMQLELRHIQRRVGSTFLYVTHDQEEALVMSDVVVLMNEGSVVQRGTPREIYQKPRSVFASSFLGEANVLRGRVTEADAWRRVVSVADRHLFAGFASGPSVSADAWVMLRPERITVNAGDDVASGRANTATGVVSEVIFLGPTVRYVVDIGGVTMKVDVPDRPDSRVIAEDECVALEWQADAVAIFAEDPAQ